ncbi:hypothetical protein ElyMa_004983400 [Elysia marginata]|uniref:Uncharacterized protein n=1 Tax=Elysia marginata TaxID=1093978 RepID=A0AAV4J562_9GAST|nr:hypothetical protein ElyMa_004983400 [Elysia marginata]
MTESIVQSKSSVAGLVGLQVKAQRFVLKLSKAGLYRHHRQQRLQQQTKDRVSSCPDFILKNEIKYALSRMIWPLLWWPSLRMKGKNNEQRGTVKAKTLPGKYPIFKILKNNIYQDIHLTLSLIISTITECMPGLRTSQDYLDGDTKGGEMTPSKAM